LKRYFNLFHLMREMYLDKLAMAGGEVDSCCKELNMKPCANIVVKIDGMIVAYNSAL
jgi:hypothetical protein